MNTINYVTKVTQAQVFAASTKIRQTRLVEQLALWAPGAWPEQGSFSGQGRETYMVLCNAPPPPKENFRI